MTGEISIGGVYLPSILLLAVAAVLLTGIATRLLAPRLALQGEDPGKPLLDALADLRVGVAVGELRQLRLDGSETEDALITPVLRGVGTHYRALRPNEPAPPEPELLAGIDRALTGFGASLPERHRSGVLALTSLRRNLFPQALAYQPGVEVTT